MNRSADLVRRIRLLLPRRISRKLPRLVAVRKVSDASAANLNRRYRLEQKPVNVLSFRYVDGYGVILVCPVVIRREARVENNSFEYQLTWMIMHGMIHLSGLHHEKSRAKAAETLRIEQQILSKIRGTKSHHRA
jgi:probable rRNA maturation factor